MLNHWVEQLYPDLDIAAIVKKSKEEAQKLKEMHRAAAQEQKSHVVLNQANEEAQAERADD